MSFSASILILVLAALLGALAAFGAAYRLQKGRSWSKEINAQRSNSLVGDLFAFSQAKTNRVDDQENEAFYQNAQTPRQKAKVASLKKLSSSFLGKYVPHKSA